MGVGVGIRRGKGLQKHKFNKNCCLQFAIRKDEVINY